MRPRILVVAAALTLTAALTSATPNRPAQAAADDLDCAAAAITKDLDNGASWRMCAYIHPIKGLVLEKIEFQPASGVLEYSGYKRVLDQIYLAQLNVPYDNGNAFYNDIPSYGFGNEYLLPQVADLCLGEAIDVRQTYTYRGQLIDRTIPGICTHEVPTGLSTHSQMITEAATADLTEHGTALEVSSLSQISWYEYQQKVTFDDHGQIDVALGATGDLAPGSPGSPFFGTDPATGWPVGPPIEGQEYFAASHWHNAIYRVDFGIDEGTHQDVERWDYDSTEQPQGLVVNGVKSHESQAFSSIPSEDHDELTWWRVLNPDSPNKDGHARSYEIVNQAMTDRFYAVTQPSVSFTNANPCQEYSTDNLHPGCPGQSILDYVAHDDAPLTDPVGWVNVGFHHIVRDEDQSPMPIHWQRFQLVPRDFFALSPAVTASRMCINGPPVGLPNSAGSCVATNTVRPRVTADTAGIRPGTTLTADTGTWAAAGITWNYAFLWFRDGVPITSPEAATDPEYTVTDADRGTTITVKVTASQTGYGSGTAESLPTTVPAAPTPTPTTPSPTATTSRPVKLATATSARLIRSRITTRQNARVRVAVTARGARPVGRVQVRHGSKVLRTATLKNGRVTITVPKLRNARKYRLRVVYLGNASAKPSKSGLLALRVARK